MKNKEYWNAKKELDTIEAALNRAQREKAEMEQALINGGESVFSEVDKKLYRENARFALFVSALAGVFTLALVMAVLFMQKEDFSSIWLIPSVAVFFIMIPVTYSVSCKKSRNAAKLIKTLNKLSKGVYDSSRDAKKNNPYADAFECVHEIAKKAENRNNDLKTALGIAYSANESKSDFLSNMSHEMRTPINAIMGMNEMVVRESSEDNIRNYSMEAKNAALALLSTVDDLLDASKIENGRMEIIPLSYDFGDMITALAESCAVKAGLKGLKFELKVDPDIPVNLFGDEARIRQCIKSLLSNGVKFTKAGSVSLEIGYSKTGHDEIELAVTVKDTGIGIEKAKLEKILEPFERMDTSERSGYSGCGIGLFITDKLLKMMSSKLYIDSTVGVGSAFSFKLIQKVTDWKKIGNISEKLIQDVEKSDEYTESFHAPEGRILVVDDSTVNLMIVEGLLKDTQVVVDTAESGPEAISLAKINKYDIAYVDHMMPGMDGVETMRHIRNDAASLNRRIPIIVFTANVVPGGKEEYVREGFDDYLPKPVDPKALEQSVRDNMPKYKLQFVEKADEGMEEADETRDPLLEKIGHIQDIIPALGISYAGGIELYKKVAEDFSETGLSRADMIEQYYEQGDVKNYTIQVHALKSSARLLGNQKLSEFAEKMENAGKENDVELIEKETGRLLKQFKDTVTDLLPLFETKEDLPEIDVPSLKDALMAISEMVEAFDFDSADRVMNQLKKYRMPGIFSKDYSKLKTLMAEVARDDIIELVKNAMNILK